MDEPTHTHIAIIEWGEYSDHAMAAVQFPAIEIAQAWAEFARLHLVAYGTMQVPGYEVQTVLEWAVGHYRHNSRTFLNKDGVPSLVQPYVRRILLGIAQQEVDALNHIMSARHKYAATIRERSDHIKGRMAGHYKYTRNTVVIYVNRIRTLRQALKDCPYA